MSYTSQLYIYIYISIFDFSDYGRLSLCFELPVRSISMTLGRTFDVDRYELFVTVLVAPVCAAIDKLRVTLL
jgi:hypothetical protein